ncbi:MAG TPA: hypothetical protein VHC42_03990 [Rhizomicrobium sp.]|nr:hypothetical protein [Rhizomicrobium sp.]
MKGDFLRSNVQALAAAAVIGLASAFLTTGARAGVASDDTVLLDPFDPVPEIQFRHFGGNGCFWTCARRCWHGCGSGDSRIRRFDRDAARAERDHLQFRKDHRRFREDHELFQEQMDDYLNRYGSAGPDDEFPTEYYDDRSGPYDRDSNARDHGPVEDLSPRGGGDFGDRNPHQDRRAAPSRDDRGADDEDDYGSDDPR